MQPDKPLFYTVPEVMELTRLGRWKVYALIRSGELRSVKIGRDRRIPAHAVVDFATRLDVEAVA
jgi:excisionase family DNA binding protein